jgi:hypothetical protein
MTLLMICLMAVGNLSGQSRKAFQKEADKAFQAKDFYSALSYYGEMLLFERDLVTLYMAAESARGFDAYSIAEDYYREVMDIDSMFSYPMSGFYLAQMLQRQGKYEEAALQYKLFISENEDGQVDDGRIERAKKEEAASNWAMDQVANPRKNVEVKHLGTTVNTPYSEFGALRDDDGLYFSSLRFARRTEDDKRLRLFSDNLYQNKEGSDIVVDSTLDFGPERHVAHTSFNFDKTTMFFTVCEYLNDKDIRCDLYQRKAFPNGSWREPQKLDAPINSEDSLVTTTMPHVTVDERLGKEVLYFVSNRDGGKGGLDIYYSVINDNGDLSSPMNLSGLNTPQDDVTPFYHTESSMLYFSSQGYLGLGGFDVYRSYQGSQGWGKVEHLGAPLNSSYHEVYFALQDNGIDALMSSNRTGSLYLDGQSEACCYDIYEIEILPCDIDLHAFTFDAIDGDSLKGVNLVITNLTTGQEIIYNDRVDSLAHHIIPIECETEYEIKATKPGYQDLVVGFRSPDAGTQSSMDKLLYLYPSKVELVVNTFDRLSNEALAGCEVKLFDLTTGEVVTAPISMTGNSFSFDVQPCHNYEIIATKEGYTQAQEMFSVPCDVPHNTVIEKDLFLATGLLDLLPIYLYFDNDRPDRRTVRRTTEKYYTQTYENYVVLKDTFIAQYAKAYTDVSSTRADVEISNFFDNEVRRQYEKFLIFIELLEKELEAGRDYDIVLRGFASPRASSTYNQYLSARRVDCVRNEFENYNDGVLIPYMRDNLLRISEKVFGEAQAPPDVNDDLSNPVQSIFSPAASKERRVEIVDVKKVSR